MMTVMQYCALALLCVFLLVRGILPAMESVNTDFPNYFTSATLLVEGRDMSKLYDDSWFQGQIYKLGMNQLGKFTPFPPITAFVLTPLVFLSPLNALRVWTVFNVALLAFAVFLLSQIVNRSWLWGALVFLLSGHALANNFKFGQFYLLLTVLVLMGYQYWDRGDQVKGGICFGLGAAVKYFPIVFLVEFISRREWKVILAGVLTIFILTAATLIVLGSAVYGQFFLRVLGKHLEGNIQDPFSPTFQSWNSLLRRLFIFDSGRNPDPLFNSSAVFLSSLCCVYMFVVALLIAAFKQLSHRSGAFAKDIRFALLCMAALLLLPASATYHFLLLILPVALVLKSEVWTAPQKLVAVLYGLMGFIPYHDFEQFHSNGVLAVFSYPRLILMTGLFLSTVAFAWTEPLEISERALYPA